MQILPNMYNATMHVNFNKNCVPSRIAEATKKSPPQEQEFYRKIAKLAFRGEEDLVGGIDPLSNFMDLADIEHW